MAEAFLGLKVSVLLNSGIKLEGEVSQIEPSTQQMTLKDVTLFIFGQPPHRTPVYGVFGKDVKDLQVLSASTSTTNYLDNHVLEQIPPQQQQQKVVVTPTKSVSKNRKSKQQYVNNNNTNNNKRNGNEGWAGEDVDIFREEEFDFQKNLNMFDKAKIFAEIRESDETAQEELLVTLNRLPQKKVNLLPTENVLDNINNNDDDDDFGDESDNDSQTPNIQKKKKSNRDVVKSSDGVIITTKSSGIICSTVSPLQMAHVEHECTKASNSFEELSIENGGRGSALLILQLLNQPSVVILAGNNKNGAIGLVCARHLINHGCKVTVCITSKKENLCNAIIKYKSIAERFGVIILYNLNNIEEKPDLVVDSILGSDEKLIDIQDKSTFHIICKSIHWANNQSSNIPILSMDFPSGIDPSTGKPHIEYFIKPNWTLSLGAPKNGCKSHHITGDLYLVDIGIPRLCWKRIGIKGNTMPWGADFLVALKYK